MKKFVFKAKNWQGKTIKGVVEAKERKGAIVLLKERDLVVLSLESQRKTILGYFRSIFLMRISSNQIVGFTRQLSTMINVGLPLTEALGLIKEQVSGRMEQIIEEVLAKVQGGDPLGKALEKEKKVFGNVYIASIKAGEEGGVLDKVLLRLANNLEKKKEFVGKVKGAMIYPAIIIIGMVVVSFIMMIFVIPKMTSLYSEFGTEMPLATRVLIGIADFVSRNVWLFPLLIVGLVIAFRAAQKNKETRKKLDELKLKVPVMGPLTKAMILTEISRTLGTLLGTGVPLVDALKIVGEASGNEVFHQGLNRSAKRVEKGLLLSDSIAENPAFPPIVSQLVATGEQTGKLDEILNNISRYFEMEAEQRVKTLTSAIEPLIMILLGLGVGFLVIAIIMPIYNLTSQF